MHNSRSSPDQTWTPSCDKLSRLSPGAYVPSNGIAGFVAILLRCTIREYLSATRSDMLSLKRIKV